MHTGELGVDFVVVARLARRHADEERARRLDQPNKGDRLVKRKVRRVTASAGNRAPALQAALSSGTTDQGAILGGSLVAPEQLAGRCYATLMLGHLLWSHIVRRSQRKHGLRSSTHADAWA